jgi:SNF2 family DNA or RNA helicase
MQLIPTVNSGKLLPLVERLAEVGIDPSDPAGDSVAIVASQSIEMVDMVEAYLEDIGISTVKITGKVTGPNRKAAIDAIQRPTGDNPPRVLLMTTTAGGVAITLDRADSVHLLDETWVPDDQEQLEDRAVNMSKERSVAVYHYRMKDTVEEYIYRLNESKGWNNRDVLDYRRNGFRADMRGR